MDFDAIVFDFDGVLVESTDVKTEAFGRLYREYGTDISERVMEYHRMHTGISRFSKFKYWQEELLAKPYSDEIGAQLSARFSAMVVDAVVSAPYVPGALEFLKAHHRNLPLYVASGTPESELKDIIRRRAMGSYFAAVRGAPAMKAEILRDYIRCGPFQPNRVLMVGDARADWLGACEVGTAFIGRAANGCSDEFPPETVGIADLRGLPSAINIVTGRT